MTSPYTAVNEVRTTHTPGPWVVAGKDDQTGQINVMTDDGEYYVAGAISGFTSAGRQEANARLIAAAPDHAMICWAMCVAAGRWEPSSNGGEFCINGIRYSTNLDEFGSPVVNGPIRAAILKAQGSSS